MSKKNRTQQPPAELAAPPVVAPVDPIEPAEQPAVEDELPPAELAAQPDKARMKNREGGTVTSFSLDGVQYDADAKGEFLVEPAHAFLAAKLVGLVGAE